MSKAGMSWEVMAQLAQEVGWKNTDQDFRCEVATQPLISELVTIRNVPMVSTGIDYPTSTGLITFTEHHLQDMVASQQDPAVHPPRTKIGHSDPRFNVTVTPDGDVLDGEPSLGTWCNLYIGDNGQTVYGDIVGVPRWFGQIVSTAYPSRSIEGNFDVETVTGHKWAMVVDAVAMLGVIGPGVTTLADLPLLFSEEGPENVRVVEAAEGDPMSVIRSRIAAAAASSPPNYRDGTATENCSLCTHYSDGTCSLYNQEVGADMLCDSFAAATTAASAGNSPTVTATGTNLDDVRRGFYDSLESAQFWWWIRAIYFDPNELIVDDDEGCLYRVPFTTGDTGVEFSDPVPVVIQYVDLPQEDTVAASAVRASVAVSLRTGEPAATYSRVESRPGGSMTPEQIAALRARTGLTPEQLPDDADDAHVLRVLSEPVAASSEPPAAAPASAPTPVPATAAPAPVAAAPASAPTPPSAYPAAIPNTVDASRVPGSAPPVLPDGVIAIDRETWEAVANQAREGAEVAARQRDTERDRFLDDAIQAGKFPPSRREHYLTSWNGDPEGTRGLIDTLSPGLVPIEARGSSGKPGTNPADIAAESETPYDSSWLTTAERNRIARAEDASNVATLPRVTQGGD